MDQGIGRERKGIRMITSRIKLQKTKAVLALLLLIVFTVLMETRVQAQVEIVQDFNCQTIGCDPTSPLMQANDGFLYGTTVNGGANAGGAIFRVQPDGSTFSVIKTFDCALSTADGCFPTAGLIQLPDGILYGTASGGGEYGGGIVFKVSPDGTNFSVIKNFQCHVPTDSCGPIGGLIYLSDGFLYGTTNGGGIDDAGTVFRLMPDGSNFSVIKSFQCGSINTEGCFPTAELIYIASDGFLYGTTPEGGEFGGGTAFRLEPNGSNFTTIRSFQCKSDEGCNSQAALLAVDGTLYGSTEAGGANDGGTIFKIRPDGSNFGLIKSFQCGVATDGCDPATGLIHVSNGFLYGTTRQGGASNQGTVFKLKTDGTEFSVVDSFFLDVNDGFDPQSRLMLANNGYLYGTTNQGGASGGGTIYRLLPALGDSIPPTVVSIVRANVDPTNAGSVSWTVTFSENVTGVDASDFTLVPNGVTGASISAVTGSNAVYTVTANTGSGSGALGLNLVDDDSIKDGAYYPLAGTGAGNGNFTGQAYALDKTAPDTNLTAQPSNPSNSTTATFQFTSTEANSTFECKLDATPFAACTNPQTYNNLSNASHTFQVRALDSVGNVDQSPAIYTWTVAIDDSAPRVVSIVRANANPTNANSVSWTVTFSENVYGVNGAD